MPEKSISLFAPAFNEEGNIENFIKKADEVLKSITDDFEIIIVNDGSKDKTREIAEGLKKEFKNLKLVNHEKNKGYGEALKSGFANSKKEIVVFTDSDLQLDVSEISNFLKHIDNYPVVIGYRINRRDNFLRRFNAFGWKILMRIFLGLKVKDIDCAFKMFKKEVLKEINLKSSSALVSAELLTKIINRGYKIKEIPVNHYPRKEGKQTGNKPKVIFRAFKELIILRKEIKSEKPYQFL